MFVRTPVAEMVARTFPAWSYSTESVEAAFPDVAGEVTEAGSPAPPPEPAG
jgi:hypothetical protein